MTKDTEALREALKDLARGVFIDAATITHHSWVDGTNGREPDFDEYAGDYAESFADAYVDNITAALATPASDVAPVACLPEMIGRLHLGENRASNERLCNDGHAIPVGHPLYWPQQMGEHDDNDPYCLTHAIERAESDSGWCATCLDREHRDSVAHPPAHPVDPVAGGEALRDALVSAACDGIADDYMTSEKHHPGYVLIPSAKFEAILAALKGPAP